MEEKNLIFCAYAHDDSMKGSVNLNGTSDFQINTYLKNAVVALVSAKLANPTCDVALVTNIEIPLSFKEIFNKNSVSVFYEAFDSFRFDQSYKWGLAFYKLCALKKMLAKGYARYLLIDLDSFTQSSLDDLWLETDQNILLYDINHRLTNANCTAFNKEIAVFCGDNKHITNYGGEFIAAGEKLLKKFIFECEQVYNQMIESGFRTNFGDEFIINIVAERLKTNIKNAGAYVFRYWTGDFYLASTCYLFNPISVFHVPDHKQKGMIKLYNYFIKHGRFPKLRRVYSIFDFPSLPFKIAARSFFKKLLDR